MNGWPCSEGVFQPCNPGHHLKHLQSDPTCADECNPSSVIKLMLSVAGVEAHYRATLHVFGKSQRPLLHSFAAECALSAVSDIKMAIRACVSTLSAKELIFWGWRGIFILLLLETRMSVAARDVPFTIP